MTQATLTCMRFWHPRHIHTAHTKSHDTRWLSTSFVAKCACTHTVRFQTCYSFTPQSGCVHGTHDVDICSTKATMHRWTCLMSHVRAMSDGMLRVVHACICIVLHTCVEIFHATSAWNWLMFFHPIRQGLEWKDVLPFGNVWVLARLRLCVNLMRTLLLPSVVCCTSWRICMYKRFIGLKYYEGFYRDISILRRLKVLRIST